MSQAEAMRGKMQIAVSFENGLVKVVKAVSREGRLAVIETSTFEEAEFPFYLKRAKANEFLVACDFPDLLHETLLIPPAKPRYLRVLVEREVKKRFPEVKDSSIVFNTFREQVKDGRKAYEVLVYVIDKARLQKIVNIFESNGKRVSFLYPSILPIALFVHASLESRDETLLSVIDGGVTKTLLVSKDGHILFLRVIQSRASGIDAIDADNINMTVTYSRQTLRAEPARIVILGAQETPMPEEIKNRLIVPAISLDLHDSILLDSNVARDGSICSALALFLYASELRWGNLVPPEHTAFFLKKKILRYGAVYFFCCSLTLSGYSLKTLAEIPGLNARMTDIRADMARRQSVWSEWIKARDELNIFMPAISFSNTVGAAPDVVSALHALSFLPAKDVSVQALRFANTPEGIRVEIKGELTADKYGDMSAIYQNLLQNLKKTGRIEVISHSLEVKSRHFSIEGLLMTEERGLSDG
jgi:hypothetical protein